MTKTKKKTTKAKPKTAKGSQTHSKKAPKRSTKSKKSAKRKKASTKSKRVKGAGTSSRGRVTIASVRAAAFELGCVVAGAKRLGIVDIGVHFKKHPKHKAAWDRGLLLRDLRDMGAYGVPRAAAAEKMGMTAEAFEELLAVDTEAASVWNRAHIDKTIEVYKAVAADATSGKRFAVETFLRGMRSDLVRPDVDFNRVDLAAVVAICGVTRQTVHAWVTQFAAPQNADGTYSLVALWKWYEGFIAQKIEGGKVKVPAEVSDPLRFTRAKKLSMEVDVLAGTLLDRDEVVAGILARHQQFLNAVNGKAEEMAISLAGQPSDVVVKALTEFFDGIKGELCYVPDELRLDDKAKVLMLDLMKEIGATEDAEGTEGTEGKS